VKHRFEITVLPYIGRTSIFNYFANTAGCNKLEEVATLGWRISVRTYSRQHNEFDTAKEPAVGTMNIISAQRPTETHSSSKNGIRSLSLSTPNQPTRWCRAHRIYTRTDDNVRLPGNEVSDFANIIHTVVQRSVSRCTLPSDARLASDVEGAH